jgi:regulator of sigma E protease
MNVILGIAIFIMMVYLLGEQYIPADKVNQFGIQATELGKKEIGFQDGDKIVGMNGQPLLRFNDIHNPRLFLEQGSYYMVQRAGNEIKLSIPADLMDKLSKKEMDLATPMFAKYPVLIGQVSGNSPASKAGLIDGDVVLAVNAQPTGGIDAFRALLEKSKDQQLRLQVRRGDQTMEVPVKVSGEGKLGVVLEYDGLYAKQYFGFFESIPKGVGSAFNVISLQLQAFGKIFRREISATKSLGGPLAIAQQFGGRWDWIRFWTLTGLLSMVLAFMNLLPIPALDGGHVVFITYEIISGRKPSDKFLENAQKVGMVLLLCLMVFVFGNDIYKIISEFGT